VDVEFHQLDLRHADLRIRDEDRRRRLAASIADIGQQAPVVVVADAERLVLIDGYLRVEVLRRLGRDTAAATVWDLCEADALIQRHHLFAAAGGSAIEAAWLLARLHREHGLGQDELARRFCRSRSWVSRRLALVEELDEGVQAPVRAGVIAPQAAMKYLVPLARANRRDCDQLVAAIGQRRVSVREVGELYAGYRRADREGRERLVENPHLFLDALRQREPEVAPADDPATALAKDLSALSGIAWRARQRLRDAGHFPSHTDRRSALVGAWRAAQCAFDALRETFQEAWPDARPDDASHDSQAA
jgi:ParB-like chromosome segregation protein Spo0J